MCHRFSHFCRFQHKMNIPEMDTEKEADIESLITINHWAFVVELLPKILYLFQDRDIDEETTQLLSFKEPVSICALNDGGDLLLEQ